ncbi:hypothetical protein EST38_g4515 [Candolleomyces aberdarensis]|uniref:BZIP domain-containing protein n=1 Tax=Candolleomyces aberdarensis TaxID=2316362 RepID=A0A4V1Q498_9AGAR|nr:hypothetical protein EST38_g4515 [Candolleomyces aberdarensis]
MQRFSPNTSSAGLAWLHQPDYEDAHDIPVIVKSELTSSPDHRLLRLPTPAVPSTPTSTSFAPRGAILPINRPNTTSTARQDVPLVNSSASSTPAIRTSGHQSSLETSVSSSTPSSHHVVTNNNKRLRTTNQVFASSSDLAAHYGIPQILPPPPIASTHRTAPSTAPALFDFNALKNQYLNMLATTPGDNSTSTSMSVGQTASPAPAPVPAAGATAQSNKEFQDLVEYFGMLEKFSPIVSLTHIAVCTASPEFKDAPVIPEFDMNQYLTSPLPELLHDFDSPEETPYHDFLTTPVIASNDHDLGGDFDLSMPLFGDYEPVEQDKQPSGMNALDMDAMFTMSPGTPMLDTPSLPMHNSPHLPTTQLPSTTPTTASGSRRRVGANGTRKGITPESLVSIDAPTQPRKYVTPSATSRKELPAVFARKRARSQALGDEEDELEGDQQGPGPNATEREQIEWKRRQNTLAARKSRKRKLQHQQDLEDNVRTLAREREVWKTRALTFRQLLVSHGIPFNEFQD